jgi:hypothetical protein
LQPAEPSSHRNQKLYGFVAGWILFTVIFSAVMLRAFAVNGEPASESEAAFQPTETIASTDIAPTPLPEQQFDLGVVMRETQPTVGDDVLAGYLDAARNQLNLNWVRVQMRWDFVEPRPGAFDWATWDRFFRLASQQDDLKVMLTLLGSPRWARPPGLDPALNAPPSDLTAYRDFAVTVLRRYPNQIDAIEIWQEMNISTQWAGPDGVNAADYVEMATLAARGIREVNPNILIVSGGLEPTSNNEVTGTVDNFVYLDNMLAGGILSAVDCIGVHHNGYNVPPGVPWDNVPPNDEALFRGPFDNPHHSWSFFSTVNTSARKVVASGASVPICVTDFGWPTAEDLPSVPQALPFAADNTLQQQRRYIIEAVELMQEWGFVRLAFVDNLNSGPEGGFDPQNVGVAYSLIRPQYSQSPAWLALADLNFRAQED